MSVLDDLERLDKAATKGMWIKETRVRYAINAGKRHVAMVSDMRLDADDGEENDANADLITTSRNALPNLLRLARAAENECRQCATRAGGGTCVGCEIKEPLHALGIEV